MSRHVPRARDTEKDQLLRDIQEYDAHVSFEDDEYDALRRLPTAALFLLQKVLTRTYRAGKRDGSEL